MIHAIAAMSQNRVIGINNKLPWNIPEDLKHFREVTRNSVVIMGRKTYESIGKPLPNRINIVISRNIKNIFDKDIYIVSSKDEALTLAKKFYKEIFIIGGEQIYTMFISDIEHIYLTIVHVTIVGDAFFPNTEGFREIKRENHNEHFPAYSFIELVK